MVVRVDELVIGEVQKVGVVAVVRRGLRIKILDFLFDRFCVQNDVNLVRTEDLLVY